MRCSDNVIGKKDINALGFVVRNAKLKGSIIKSFTTRFSLIH